MPKTPGDSESETIEPDTAEPDAAEPDTAEPDAADASPTVAVSPRPSYWPLYALAASLLFTVGFAFLSLNLFLQIMELEAQVTQTTSSNEAESSSLESTLEGIRGRLEGQGERLAAATARVAELEKDLEESNEDLAKSQGFLPHADLFPKGSFRSTGSVLEVPSSARLFAVALRQPGTRSYASYRLDVLNAGGRRLLIERGLRRSAEGVNSFQVALPRSAFESGRYLLRVLGVGSGSPKTIGEYELELRMVEDE